MSKPLFPSLDTSQTFQNWLDSTNDIIDVIKSSAVTASVIGDSTTGDATLIGDFTANTVVAYDIFKSDSISSRTAGQTIVSASPIRINSSAQKIASTFNFAASGAQTRYTNEVLSWDIGIDNNTDFNFIMNQGGGGQFILSPAGVLTVPSLTVTTDINFPTDANGAFTGVLSVADANISGTLTANNATFVNATGGFNGTFTGDVYHPHPQGGNGAGKVLENGGPASNIPATFFGNVNGTVSSLTNHTTNTLAEGTNNSVGANPPGSGNGTNNLYFTNARARGALSGGTGVTYNNTSGVISIGQSVGTAANVTFASVTATGNITAYGTVSDITMKENIVPIDNALEKVSKLGGYFFNYKGDDNQMTGVMAQELMDVLPGVVYETEDPRTKETVYAVRHGNIIGLLIEAIKELQQKVGK